MKDESAPAGLIEIADSPNKNARREITHEPACTIPHESATTEDAVEAQIQQYLTWWERSGRFSPTGQ
jgi:hypothetical protein